MPRLAATSHTHSRGTRLSACKIRARVGSASSANTAVARSISATPASCPRTAATSPGWTLRTVHESATIERLCIHNSLAQPRGPAIAAGATRGLQPGNNGPTRPDLCLCWPPTSLRTVGCRRRAKLTSLTTRLAAGGAAVLAAAALAACGSASTGPPATPATPAAASPSAAPYNAADVAFTSGIIRLEGQARALGGLAAAHTSSTQLRSYASQLGDDTADSQHMSGMMQRWHQALPSPYQPGTAMGPGMMSGHDWAGMQHQYVHECNGHWLDAMMANRSAELALCRAELRAGASPQARHLAQAMLTGRSQPTGQAPGPGHAHRPAGPARPAPALAPHHGPHQRTCRAQRGLNLASQEQTTPVRARVPYAAHAATFS